MSQISYGPITLPYGMTTQFRQEPVYDDVGNTDWYLTRITLETQTYLNADYISTIAPSLVVAGSTPVQIMNSIRTTLLKPRQRLAVTFNGVNLIPQNNLPGSVDAKNGPMPQHCTITSLMNETFILTFGIVAHYWENRNDPTGSGNQAVLFNRWTETVEIDGANYTTRTRSGKYVIRSDNSAGAIADNSIPAVIGAAAGGGAAALVGGRLRTAMAVLGLPPGFLRQSSRYTVSPDGLGLEYTVVDREVYLTPPAPAFRATGDFTISAPRMGAQRFCQVHVALEGSKTTPKQDLLYTAIAICVSKLRMVGVNLVGPSKSTLESASISTPLWENKVDVNLRARYAPSNNRSQGIWDVLLDPNFTVLPGNATRGGGNEPPSYLAYGTAGLIVQAAAYYDPNLNTYLNQNNNQLSRGLQPGQAGIRSGG